MSLICMAVYDTEENGRSEYTRQTLESLLFTVDWSKNRLIIIDNDSCEETKILLRDHKLPEWVLLTLTENIGTARAINMGIKLRKPGEHIIKLDNDVVIHQSGWIEQMEEVIERDSSIGIVGLKRKDLAEWPLRIDWAKSEFIPLPHENGQSWICVESVNHVMGTCQMLSSSLLDKIGYFYQGDGNLYGFDDSLMSLRSKINGFKNVFLFHIPISHIDVGGGTYSEWKHNNASDRMNEYNKICEEYKNGTRNTFYSGE